MIEHYTGNVTNDGDVDQWWRGFAQSFAHTTQFEIGILDVDWEHDFMYAILCGLLMIQIVVGCVLVVGGGFVCQIVLVMVRELVYRMFWPIAMTC